MKNVIVAIKMPGTMVDELKAAAKARHFMDVSEEIRSIVRQKWLMYNDPELMKMKKLKEGIKKELEKKGAEFAKRKILRDLEQIRSELENAK